MALRFLLILNARPSLRSFDPVSENVSTCAVTQEIGFVMIENQPSKPVCMLERNFRQTVQFSLLHRKVHCWSISQLLNELDSFAERSQNGVHAPTISFPVAGTGRKLGEPTPVSSPWSTSRCTTARLCRHNPLAAIPVSGFVDKRAS